MSATVDQVETKLKAVKLAEVLGDDQKENCEVISSTIPEKKKGKGKKKSKASVEKSEKNEEKIGVVLQEMENNTNQPPLQDHDQECCGPVCAFCKKAGPTKRCSKRHQKCLPKMFCNETCEALAHEDKKSAVAKKEASKAIAAKKKTSQKIKNWKNTDSGQFWWHDQ